MRQKKNESKRETDPGAAAVILPDGLEEGKKKGPCVAIRGR